HLRRFGWEPTVLTVANNRAGYPVGEPVPSDIDIARVREFNLNGVVNFLQGATNRIFRWFGSELKGNTYRDLFCLPDANIAWFSLTKAVRLARKSDAIYVSCSPFSAALTGCLAKWITGKPLIVDFRDAWLLNPYNKLAPRPKRFVQWAEPWVLAQS